MNNLWLKNFLKNLRLNETMISTVLGGVVVVVVGILIYNYFSRINQANAPQPVASPEAVSLVEENGQMVPDNLPAMHTVNPGEDLWHISEQYYQSGYNWVDIAKENKLVNANLISAGQELSIPRVGIKEATKASVADQATITGNEYLVQKGDHLWKISVQAYGDGYQWPKIWEANRELITNPNKIEAGMLIKLPR